MLSLGSPSDAPPGRVLTVAALTSAIVPVTVMSVLAVALFAGQAVPLSPDLRYAGSQITRIYAADGTQIAALRAFETYIPVEAGDLPDTLKEAVVAIEDQRFYEHGGVDARAVARAAWANLNHGRVVQGGSTLTQQYVKQAYFRGRERTLITKLDEAVHAYRLERALSKDEILHRYLSTVYFGGGAYGVGAAADTYFRKTASELTLSESALLAGMVVAPTALDPRSSPEAAEARRRLVLDRMHEQGRIQAADYEAALAARISPAADADGSDRPVTVIHPPRQDQGRYAYFVDYVRRYLVARYGEDAVIGGGLRVETSLDRDLQALAEQSVREALEGTPASVGMALVAVEPSTGLVRALVGGRDFNRSQVNLALGRCPERDAADPGPACLEGGGSGRQPGSAFKTFVLARALESGMSPNRTYRAPATYTFPGCRGAGCSVRNAGGGGYGRMTLREATASSVNTVFAQLIRDVGVQGTADLARRMGLTSIDPGGRAPDGSPYGPSLALGAAEVSPLDMASAYGVLANGGRRVPPSPVTRVLRADGAVLEDNIGRAGSRVLAAPVAQQVTSVLQDTVRYGTGTAARIQHPGVAGKTGTSENHSDAWFVGYTSSLSTAVWMGHVDSQRPLAGINGYSRVFGGTIPAQTWGAFMGPALAGAAGT